MRRQDAKYKVDQAFALMEQPLSKWLLASKERRQTAAKFFLLGTLWQGQMNPLNKEKQERKASSLSLSTNILVYEMEMEGKKAELKNIKVSEAFDFIVKENIFDYML